MITQVLPWNFQNIVDFKPTLQTSWFEWVRLVGNGFVERKELSMELQTWVDFMELWTNLICSWVGSTTCSFTKVLRKEDMGANLPKTWKEEFLNKEAIREPICIKLDMKFLKQKKRGYTFVKNLKIKFQDKSN